MRRERSGKIKDWKRTARNAVYRLTPSTDSTGMDALLDRDDEYVLCWTDPTRSICVGTLSSA
jgi:hypothetical protein